MDGDVDAAVEQRLLELLHEDAALADLPERLATIAVTGCRDRNERHLHARPPQQVGCQTGLGEGEPTAAGSDPKQHRRRGRLLLPP